MDRNYKYRKIKEFLDSAVHEVSIDDNQFKERGDRRTFKERKKHLPKRVYKSADEDIFGNVQHMGKHEGKLQPSEKPERRYNDKANNEIEKNIKDYEDYRDNADIYGYRNSKKSLSKTRRSLIIKIIFRVTFFALAEVLAFYVLLSVVSRIDNGNGYDRFLYDPIGFFMEPPIALLFIVILFIGFIMIIRKSVNNIFTYIEDVIGAIEKVYDGSNKAITLNDDLTEVAYRLNTIKMELKENKNAAIDAEKRKNDLIMYLAHDLKTPLTSVIGYLGILREEHCLTEEFRQKYTDISYEKALRLEDLINEFFEITRFGINKIELSKNVIDMSMMMNQFVSESQVIANKNNLTIEPYIESGIKAKIDAGKIQRVLENLFRNAVSYSNPESAIKVVFGKVSETTIAFEVTNYGKEIPPEKIDRIFEEFFRVDSSRSSSSGNAGLGLAISKAIVEAHGGTIKAKSENGKTSMSVYLPYDPGIGKDIAM